MLCLFFLLPASIKEAWAMHPIIPLVLNIINPIFWFVGGVATAAYLNVHSCSNSDYYNSNNVAGHMRGQHARPLRHAGRLC